MSAASGGGTARPKSAEKGFHFTVPANTSNEPDKKFYFRNGRIIFLRYRVRQREISTGEIPRKWNFSFESEKRQTSFFLLIELSFDMSNGFDNMSGIRGAADRIYTWPIDPRPNRFYRLRMNLSPDGKSPRPISGAGRLGGGGGGGGVGEGEGIKGEVTFRGFREL